MSIASYVFLDLFFISWIRYLYLISTYTTIFYEHFVYNAEENVDKSVFIMEPVKVLER